MKHIIFIVSLLISQIINAQTLNYSKIIDVNKDGITEVINLYDEYNSEFEETEFTIFEIVTHKDTFKIEDIDVFVLQNKIYKNSDYDIDNRIGVFYENDNTYLWLTAYQYGCCLNRTVILKFTGDELSIVFNRTFEFKQIVKIKENRYFVGRGFLTQPVGNENFDIFDFQPLEYLNLSDKFEFNKELSAKKALEKHMIIEKEIDPYNCEILCLRGFSDDCFLISPSKSNELMEREYGITSVIMLTPDFFNGYASDKLRLIRNELFAYHGYKFKSQDLEKYFSAKSWYNSTLKSAEQVFNELTEIEKFNITLIKKLEK